MLVPSLLTGQDETYGSRALSEVQFEMFKLSRIGALQTQLQSWINHDIREMIQLNYGEQDSYPELRFRSWSRADMTKMSRMVADLITANVVTPDETWIRQFLELPERDPSLPPLKVPEDVVPDSKPLPGDRKTEVAPRAPGEDAVVSKNEEVDVDVFTTEEEAYARAQEIGCDQTHSHTLEDGTTVFMPCKTHDEYTEKVDEDLAKKKKKYYELQHELTSAEVIPMLMSQERRAASNRTNQKDLPSATEGTRKVNILALSQSKYPPSKPAAYDRRADPDLLRILKRGGKALTPTEVKLLNARELALETGKDKFRWLGEINGTN